MIGALTMDGIKPGGIVKSRKRSIPSILTKYWQLYLLLLVPLVYILIFNYYPMLGTQIAFKKYSPKAGIWGSKYVGLYYFEKLFKTYKFADIIRNTLVVSLYTVFVNIPVPTALALMINASKGQKFVKTVQMVSYMPHFISTVVVVSLLKQLFNSRIGMFAQIAGWFGMTMPDLFASPDAFPHLYVWSGIWQNVGWSSIIYIAGLSQVDHEQHEAAIVCGASRLQRVWYIDLPAIVPSIVTLFILNMGKVMSLDFEKAFLMQNQLNISTSEIISSYTYKVGLTGNMDFSYGTAIGLFNSVVNLILVLIADRLGKLVSGNGLF